MYVANYDVTELENFAQAMKCKAMVIFGREEEFLIDGKESVSSIGRDIAYYSRNTDNEKSYYHAIQRAVNGSKDSKGQEITYEKLVGCSVKLAVGECFKQKGGSLDGGTRDHYADPIRKAISQLLN